jgi:hypothetical protein
MRGLMSVRVILWFSASCTMAPIFTTVVSEISCNFSSTQFLKDNIPSVRVQQNYVIASFVATDSLVGERK